MNEIKALLFDVDGTLLKPHPAPLLKALERMSLPISSAAMIGDSHLDIEAGKNAGTKTVRATYGFHTDKLHESKPDFIINSIAELLNIFK